MNRCCYFPREINWEYFGPSEPEMHSVHVKEIWKSFVGKVQISLLEKRCIFLSDFVEF